mgnify:CR=1 FL=1
MTLHLRTIFTPILALTLLLWPSHGIGSSFEGILNENLNSILTNIVKNDNNFTPLNEELKDAVECKKDYTLSALDDLNDVVSDNNYLTNMATGLGVLGGLMDNKDDLLTKWTPKSSDCLVDSLNFYQFLGGDTDNVGFDTIITEFFQSN